MSPWPGQQPGVLIRLLDGLLGNHVSPTAQADGGLPIAFDLLLGLLPPMGTHGTGKFCALLPIHPVIQFFIISY